MTHWSHAVVLPLRQMLLSDPIGVLKEFPASYPAASETRRQVTDDFMRAPTAALTPIADLRAQ